MRMACRWKAPRVGERLASSRRRGAARPSRRVHRRSVRCAGGSAVLPRRSGQGEERSSRQEVPKAIGDGAKSLSGAIPVGSAEARCSSVPVLQKLWRLPGPKGDFRRIGTRPNDGFRSFGMFEGVRGRARGNISCRSRESARGLEGAREERTNKGLVAVPQTTMNTCGTCPGRPAGDSTPRRGSKEPLRRPPTMEGTSTRWKPVH